MSSPLLPLARRAAAIGGSLAVVLAGLLGAAPAALAEDPAEVVVAGDLQSALGCPGDWQPDCADTALSLDEASGLYSATYDLPAGEYQYKVAVGGSWDESYGQGGVPGGENLTTTHAGGPITFWYDPATHYLTDTATAPVITLPGSFDQELGCASDWAPDCMSTWMQDLDGDGVFTFSTTAIPAGSHEVKVAHGRSWDENYGMNGEVGGANYTFATQAGKDVTFRYTLSTHMLEIVVADPPVDGTGQQLGHLLDATTIAWPTDRVTAGASWELWSSPTGGLTVADGTVTGGARLGELARDAAGLTAEQLENRGHLTGFTALTLSGVDRETLGEALTGQLAVVQRDADGAVQVFTGLQIPGVLDDLYADAARRGGDLGLRFADGVPTLTLWAPTAASVSLQLFDADGANPESVPMTRQDDGTWTVTGDASWEDRSYLYDVEVYVPSLDALHHNLVTDPYSVGLTLDSERSVLLDLDDPRWAPDVWTDTPAPTVAQFADQTIYEMHVRDFSVGDTTVPAAERGTYAAFGEAGSDGTTRLRELAEAGMTTVHLLPTFDIASIEEDRDLQKTPQIPADAGPSSTAQQAAVAAVASQDAYNWGYDPFHYMTPEGSYATTGHQSGGPRTTEFRSMVGDLHDMGLQVVLDQVSNHTAASGQEKTSVLDQVVPGYYQRLSLTGSVETSTCCQNIATEHAMAEQLMVDSTVMWAKDYHVDGFRFDLMGHSSRENMLAIRSALDDLTLDEDGVDGSSIYLYGEGWNFGEVADNARFTQATQGQLDDTSIGAFNDRLRDGVHGGSPFDVDKRTHQGFGNGLSTDPNDNAEGSADTQLADLRHRTDLVRLGLAGNLKDYRFTDASGAVVTGAEVDYNGAPAGYASRPEESVNYVDAHDNETLYDMNVWKLPQDTSMDDRVRMNTLSLATTALGQSPSFWAGGTDLLRSKSLDRDSYDSGDHVNAIDWTGSDNGFGRGLPPEGKNGEAWPLMRPMLEDEALHPGSEAIGASADQTLDLLRLRSSSNLFTLGDASLIEQKVTFPNAGPEATPGLLVMRIDDTVGEDADPELDGVVTVFNVSDEAIDEAIDDMAGEGYVLSPVQADGSDAVVKSASWDAATGTAHVPARTVAVFVKAQGAEPTQRFTDVPPGTMYFDEIEWMGAEGISTGYPDGTFRPLSPVGRDAMAEYLYRLAGSPAVTPPRTQPFRDVKPGMEHYDAIIWAYQQGIARGWWDGTFRPTQAIDRDAMAAFIYRYAGEPEVPQPTTAPFRDVPAGSQFAREIAWLKSEGISTGWPDGTYRPGTPMNRDAMAAFLYRLVNEQQITYLSEADS